MCVNLSFHRFFFSSGLNKFICSWLVWCFSLEISIIIWEVCCQFSTEYVLAECTEGFEFCFQNLLKWGLRKPFPKRWYTLATDVWAFWVISVCYHHHRKWAFLKGHGRTFSWLICSSGNSTVNIHGDIWLSLSFMLLLYSLIVSCSQRRLCRYLGFIFLHGSYIKLKFTNN